MLQKSLLPLKFIALYLAISGCAIAQQLYNDDFTTAEGHSDAVAINGINNWTAQAGWVANDTAGAGYASSATSWLRGKTYTALAASLGVDDTITVEAVWRGEGLLASPIDAGVFAIGISDSVLHSGNNIPALRCEVLVGSDSTLRFGSGTDLITIPLASAYTGANTNTNWFQISMSITRLATSNWFQIDLIVLDLDNSTTLGSITYLAVDSATYLAAELHPAMRSLQLGGSLFTANHVDRFTVTEGSAIPIANVSVDLSRQLFIGGVSDFSRKQFVNWHGMAKTSEYTQAEAEYLFNDLEMRVGRNVGGFHWIRTQVTTEQPGQPGYIHQTDLTNYSLANQNSNLSNWPETLYPGLQREDMVYTDHTMGIPHERQVGETAFIPVNHAAAAQWHSIVWQNHWTSAGRPAYLEPVNEPFVHMGEYDKPGTATNIDEQWIVDFHAAIIDQLHTDVPALKVGGPCSAWPEFSLWGYDHFRNRMGLFIDDVGDRADFVSWHIYSTVIDDLNNVSSRVGSNLDYMLDLVENYANNVHGAPLPAIISEFGGGIKDTTVMGNNYSPLRDWHIIKNGMAKTLQFFQRPDRIEKIIPFIVEKATWYSGTDSYPYVIYRRPDGPGGSLPYEETHLTKYYEYFKGLVGQQFPISSDEADVIACAIVNGAQANLLLMSIDDINTHLVSLQALLEGSTTVSSATLTRLYWDDSGSVPVFSEDQAVANWQSLVLGPGEIVRIKLNLSQAPQRFDQLHRNVYYGDRTIIDYTGAAETVNIACDADLSKVGAARLRVGVTRPHGETPIPSVTFNGQVLGAPTDWPGGGQDFRSQFDGTIVFSVPTGSLLAANAVQLSFPTNVADDYFSSVVLEVEENQSVSELDVLSTLTISTDNFTLSWDTLPGVSYQVEKATVLPSFSAYGAPISGDGGVEQIVIPLTDAAAYFRVTATPE